MSYSKFRPRRGTTLQWEEANTLLNEGEIAFEFANRIGDGEAKVKIGDGARRWNDLPYAINADEIREEINKVKDYHAPSVAGMYTTFTQSGNVCILHLNNASLIYDNHIHKVVLDVDIIVGDDYEPADFGGENSWVVVYRTEDYKNYPAIARFSYYPDVQKYYVIIEFMSDGEILDVSENGKVNGTIMYLVKGTI